MSTLPTSPIVNSPYLDLHGGVLTYASTTTFTVTDGIFRDSTNTNDITLTGTSGTTTVSVSSAGLNGIDTGTVAASTIYYVYVVGSSTNGNTTSASSAGGTGSSYTVTDATNGVTSTILLNSSYLPSGILISTSSTSPLLPESYDMYRRIGAIRTTAGSVIEPFIQTGGGKNRTMRYKTPVAPGSGGPGATGSSATYTTIGALAAVVPQISVDVLVNCALSAGTAGNCLFLTASNGTSTPPAITLYYSRMSSLVGVGGTLFQEAQLVCPCALNNAGNMEIDYCTQTYAGVGTSNDNLAFSITGYVDVI